MQKNIVDHEDKLSGPISGGIGWVLGGPAGALIGAAVGDKAKSTREITCNADDIVAVVTSGTSKKCK